MESRPSRSPQIQRNWRRPSQRQARLLFRSRRLVVVQETPRCCKTRKDSGHERSLARPDCRLPTKVRLLLKYKTLVYEQLKWIKFIHFYFHILNILKRFYLPLVLTLCFAVPTFVPWFYWNESLITAFFVAAVTRYVITLNITWLVNSAGHLWGNHPYDKLVH